MFLHIYTTLKQSKRVDLSLLGQSIVNYGTQEIIWTQRVQQFLAAALFYDRDLSTTMRSLRSTYTGKFCNEFSTLSAFRRTCYDPTLVQEIFRTLLVSSPNKMTACSLHANFFKFFRYGNRTSVKRNLPNVFKNINTEDIHQYLLSFPNWLTRFVDNFHLTP